MMRSDTHYGIGRYIDPEVGLLEGEGSHQYVRSEREHPQRAPVPVWTELPVRHFPAGREPDYYNRPTVKEPVWIWSVPFYFYVGGIAGAAGVFAAVLQTRQREDLRDLRKKCRIIGAVGATLGSGFLIHDLGRPSRFLNMLRVLRPTSPMSLGSWTLAAAGGAYTASLLAESDTRWKAFGKMAGTAGGLLGIPLAGYTGVLLGNTAVPIWQESRRALPALFIASGMAGLGDMLEMIPLSDKENKVARRFGTVGKAAELASSLAVEKSAGRVSEIALPLKQGTSSRIWKAAKTCTAASLALSLLPIRHPWKRRTAAVLGTAGALMMRFGLFEAGKASSQDPQATFRQQRAGHGAAEVTGRPGIGEELGVRGEEKGQRPTVVKRT